MKDLDWFGGLIAIVMVLAVIFVLAWLTIQRPTLQTQKAAMIEKSDRFTISSQGSFSAGHGFHIREILIIKDTKTGKEYIGITGVGVTEIVGSGKTVTEE